MSEDFYPDLRRPKQPVLFIAIDMWGIEGQYADGNWHSLVHDFAMDWARKNPQQENATLWSSVQPCAIFLNGTSCYMATSTKLPRKFLQDLESHLQTHCGSHTKIAGEVMVSRADGWRPYLHFEAGNVWEQIDAVEWRGLLRS
ncbi:hypothetical protein ACNFH8_24825 [Pseudomonas sp. NY15436]|uniref:hypothetical protein n=1 Tax=Pseudomonas sp. NY15436 TaxID=3400359 RepID=UPI003A8914C7